MAAERGLVLDGCTQALIKNLQVLETRARASRAGTDGEVGPE
jgi:hypothetical protein